MAEATKKKQEDPISKQHDNIYKPSREDGDIPKQTASASQSGTGGSGSGSASSDSSHHQHRPNNTVSPSNTPKRMTPHRSTAAKSAPAGLRSADHSPLHPSYYRDKASGGTAKGNNSVSTPLWEKRSSDGGLGPSTPSRAKLKAAAKGTETLDKSEASVPRFADWDEKDPSSADGYTQVFNRLREERQGGPRNVAAVGAANPLSGRGQNQRGNGKEESCCGCFPWGGN